MAAAKSVVRAVGVTSADLSTSTVAVQESTALLVPDHSTNPLAAEHCYNSAAQSAALVTASTNCFKPTSGSLVNMMQELEDMCHSDLTRDDDTLQPATSEPTTVTCQKNKLPSSSDFLSLPAAPYSSRIPVCASAEAESQNLFLAAKDSCVRKIRRLYNSCPLTASCWDNSLDWHIGTILQCDTWMDLSTYTSALQFLVSSTKLAENEDPLNTDATKKVLQHLDQIRATKSGKSIPSIPPSSLRSKSRVQAASSFSRDEICLSQPSQQKSGGDCLSAAIVLLAKSINLPVEAVSSIVAPKKMPPLRNKQLAPVNLDGADGQVWNDVLRQTADKTHQNQSNQKPSDDTPPGGGSPEVLTPNSVNRAMKGVSFDRSKKNWEASWLDARTGRRVKKCFSEGRWGSSARHMAVMARKEAETSGVISTRCQNVPLVCDTSSCPSPASVVNGISGSLASENAQVKSQHPTPTQLKKLFTTPGVYRGQFPMTTADLLPNSISASSSQQVCGFSLSDGSLPTNNHMNANNSHVNDANHNRRTLMSEEDTQNCQNRLMNLIMTDSKAGGLSKQHEGHTVGRNSLQTNSRLVELLEEIGINPGELLREKPSKTASNRHPPSACKAGISTPDSAYLPDNKRLKGVNPVDWTPPMKDEYSLAASWTPGQQAPKQTPSSESWRSSCRRGGDNCTLSISPSAAVNFVRQFIKSSSPSPQKPFYTEMRSANSLELSLAAGTSSASPTTAASPLSSLPSILAEQQTTTGLLASGYSNHFAGPIQRPTSSTGPSTLSGDAALNINKISNSTSTLALDCTPQRQQAPACSKPFVLPSEDASALTVACRGTRSTCVSLEGTPTAAVATAAPITVNEMADAS